MAVTYAWDKGSGSFSTPANWLDVTNGNTVSSLAPGIADTASIDVASAITITGAGDVAALHLADPSNTLTVAGQLTGALLGPLDGTTFAISGSGAALTQTGNTQVAIGHTTSGALVISGGGTLAMTGSAQAGAPSGTTYSNILVGLSTGVTGVVTVTGTASLLNAGSGALGVGISGSGTLAVTQGGAVEASDAEYGTVEAALRIGEEIPGTTATGSGFVTVDGAGSVIRSAGLIEVGNYGAGTLDIANFGTVVMTATSLGTDGAVIVANSAGSVGTLTVTGAGSLLNAGPGRLSVGNDGAATVLITAGGTVETSAAIYPNADNEPAVRLGENADGSGTMTVDGAGSTLAAQGALVVGDNGVGRLTVSNGGAASAGGTNDGGTGLNVSENGASASLVIDAGKLAVSDNARIGAAGSVTLESGGILSVGGTLGGAGTLGITGGTLDLGSIAATSPLISGFVSGSEVVVGSAVGATASVATSGSVTTMTLLQGTADIGTLSFAGNPALVFNAATGAVTACFAQGTRIATARGEIAVERLELGDVALGPWGERMPVRWLGHRRLDCTRHPHPDDVRPVRVRAGAFRPGAPSRDLFLSPDHAVFVAPPGMRPVLIPVRFLIDGEAVAQMRRARVTYWHVELERHAVLLAEGLPCESYLDTGNRSAFQNAGPAVALHPDFAARHWEAKACAPQMRGGPALDWARAWLAARREEAARESQGYPQTAQMRAR